MSNKIRTIGILAAIAVVVVATCTFTVRENERAIKLVLGEIARSDYEPGLHFRIPFINTVHKFDSRLLTLDVQPERVLTSEKKNVIVDSFMKWRIGDVEAYYTKTGGDERRANTLLSQVVRKATLDAFGQKTVQEVLSVSALRSPSNSAPRGRKGPRASVPMLIANVKKCWRMPTPSRRLSAVKAMPRRRRSTLKPSVRMPSSTASRAHSMPTSAGCV